jgi:hypothetical protein
MGNMQSVAANPHAATKVENLCFIWSLLAGKKTGVQSFDCHDAPVN